MKNEVDREKERPGQYIDSESPFCRNCTRDDCPTNGDGCKAWETYSIDNWNKNIMKLWKNHKKQRQFFRYEHPDLVREGIVFEHEQGENVRLFQAGEAELHPAQVGESSSKKINAGRKEMGNEWRQNA